MMNKNQQYYKDLISTLMKDAKNNIMNKTPRVLKEHSFINTITNERFYGPSCVFIKKYGLHDSSVYGMVNGKKHIVKGWIVEGTVIKPKIESSFINRSTNESFVGLASVFIKKYDLPQTSVYSMLRGKLKSVRGWTLEGAPAVDYKATKIFKFINTTTKEKFEGTTCQLIKKYNLCKTSVCAVARGRRKSVKDWIIEGTTRYRSLYRDNVCFINRKSNEKFDGLPKDFIKKYNLSQNSVYSVLRGERGSIKGWMVKTPLLSRWKI